MRAIPGNRSRWPARVRGGVALVAAVAVLIAAAEAHHAQPAAHPRDAQPAAPHLRDAQPAAHSRDAQPAAFDGKVALEYARAQVAFGPRVPGSAAARRAGDWLEAQMRQRADTVMVQRWTHRTAHGVELPMRNIFARIRPEMQSRVLYVAHWDTRPTADNDTDPERQDSPADGANDGASAVGMLMALADALKATRPSVGVDILFTDGEDYGSFGPDVDVVIGAAHFAANPPIPDYRPAYGIVWDMIGDADLRILKEGNSVRGAPEIVERVWRKAAELGHAKHFIPSNGYHVMDDHVPLQTLGWRVINVIDLDYPYHHTAGDTMDKLSVESLQVVGEVALALVR